MEPLGALKNGFYSELVALFIDKCELNSLMGFQISNLLRDRMLHGLFADSKLCGLHLSLRVNHATNQTVPYAYVAAGPGSGHGFLPAVAQRARFN